MLTDASVTIVLTEAGVSQLVPMGPWQVLDVDATERSSPDEPGGAGVLAISPGQLAYVMFTSGSTGRPKGVLIEHRCVTAFVDGVRALYPVDARDRYVQFSSLAFDVSTFDIFCALLTGASVHVASMATRRSLDRIRLLLRGRAITLYMGTPGILKLLDPGDFPDLRLLAVGGEPIDRDLADRWAPGRQFLNSYGPTETTVGVVTHRFDGSDPGSPPIGRAMPNHRAYVLDERMRPAPVGVVGELFIGGPGTGRGYLDRPALTAAAFVPDPLGSEPGSRLYRTGDLVRWRADGQLIFLGRADGQVKIRGMRVEMGEITDALLAQPQVAQAAVRAVPDDLSGVLLVAYVVPAAHAAFDEPGLRDALAARLPSYMVPSEFVPLATMPLADTGKIDEAALIVARESAQAQPGAAAPATTSTQRLLISDVLAPLLDTEAIAIDRNLFELGANSLHVLQILARVQDTFGVEVPFADFFEEPTAEGLAAAIDRAAFAALRASVRDAYDAMGPEFRRFRMTQPDALPAAIAGQLLTAPAGRGLDLGVGDGSGLSAALAEVHQVTAVDICGSMLDAARDRMPKASLVHADLLDVELPAASFDWVLAQDVLSHLPPEQLPGALARIAGWLKPGGTALLTIADDDSPAVDEWFGVPVYRAGICAASLRQLVQEAGLTVAASAPCSWSTPAGPRPAWWLLASAHRTDSND
jgi:amino acid adenylation domain-containing protein